MRKRHTEIILPRAILLPAIAAAAAAAFFVLDGLKILREYILIPSFYLSAFSGSYSGRLPESMDWDTAEKLYEGVKHAEIITSLSGRTVINLIRIDISSPDLKFCSTPRCFYWGTPGEWEDSCGNIIFFTREARAQRTRDFINDSRGRAKNVIAAVNAGSGWRPFDSGKLPFKSPSPGCISPGGLVISAGQLVSRGCGPSFIVMKGGDVLLDDLSLEDDFSEISLAVSGTWWCLKDGIPMGPSSSTSPSTAFPRTGVGISEDGRYVYFAVVDGRRSLSRGASPEQVGEILLFAGAYDGINMDGGGSTTMAMWNFDSSAVELLNTPSDGWFMLAREREVSNNLGVYAVGLAE